MPTRRTGEYAPAVRASRTNPKRVSGAGSREARVTLVRQLRRSAAGFVTLVAFLGIGAPIFGAAAPMRKTGLVSASPVVLERDVTSKLDPFLRRLARDHGSRLPLAWALPSETEKPLIRTETLADGRLAAGVFI